MHLHMIPRHKDVGGREIIALYLNSIGPVDFTALVLLVLVTVDGLNQVVVDLYIALVGMNSASMDRMALVAIHLHVCPSSINAEPVGKSRILADVIVEDLCAGRIVVANPQLRSASNDIVMNLIG